MTGHIRRRGKSSWELKFDIGADPVTGRRLTRYHSFKGTKRDAEAELVRLKATANSGDYVDPSKVTLADFLDRWERDWAAVNVSPKTLERYEELLRLHVRPYLGAVRLQKLLPVSLAELYAKLLREGRGHMGLSARTVGHVHRVLHKALQVAAEWAVIGRNPADIAKPPKVEAADVETLSAQEVGLVLANLHGEPMYRFSMLALATGMRRGELLALRWRDVDLDAANLRVEQSLEQTRAGLRFKAPKTKYGKRVIALPGSAVAELPTGKSNKNTGSGWVSARHLMTRLSSRIGTERHAARTRSPRNGPPRPQGCTCRRSACTRSGILMPRN